jgi:hypothetical protein
MLLCMHECVLCVIIHTSSVARAAQAHAAMSHGRRIKTVRALSAWKAAVRRGLLATDDKPESSSSNTNERSHTLQQIYKHNAHTSEICAHYSNNMCADDILQV